MLKTVGQLILWMRVSDYLRRHQPTLIGITGSTGKTMTKEAVALALGTDINLRTSPFSYNTPIGVALAILGAKRQATTTGWIRLLANSRAREFKAQKPDTIALELGADRPGDIDFFARKLPFSIGAVTNVQSTHLRLFGNKEMVAHEKMSLIVSLPSTGTAILNADDPLVVEMSEHVKASVIFFGAATKAEVRLRRLERLKSHGLACELAVRGKTFELHLPHVIARYQLTNILAALAIVLALKRDVKSAIRRLSKLTPPPGRMRLLPGVSQSLIIDDSYNASPESTIAALNTLSELPARRRIAILGDILDLGGQTAHWHEQIGNKAAQVADVLVAVGEYMPRAGSAALKTNTTDVHRFTDSRNVGKWLIPFLQKGDLVLVKGSRAIHMEEVVKRLLNNPKQHSNQLVR